MNQTRIVATIGPLTESEESLLSMRRAGMSIVRLNGSHNTHDWHRGVIRRVRKILPGTPILLDLPGRKIRTGAMESVSFKAGERLVMKGGIHAEDGIIPINYLNFAKDVAVGNKILADDGTLHFEISKIEDGSVTVVALNAGTLKSAKGINVPYVRVNTPLVNDRDIALIELCKEESVDFVGVSFVESGRHLDEIKKYLSGSDIQIIAKIENKYGLENLDSILTASFGIMIDRGDLSAETEVFDIAVKQKEIIATAQYYGVPVIVATEMMHTMITNHVPTKAEVNDITNAVLDGASAVMLSGETAAGDYPIESIETMSAVLKAAEAYLQSPRFIKHISYSEALGAPSMIGNAVAAICLSADITKIVCVTRTGYALTQLSRHRLRQPILVVTENEASARKLKLHWGVEAFAFNLPFVPNNSDLVRDVLYQLYLNAKIDCKDLIVTTSVRYPNPEYQTKMNHLDIYKIQELAELFDWL